MDFIKIMCEGFNAKGYAYDIGILIIVGPILYQYKNNLSVYHDREW